MRKQVFLHNVARWSHVRVLYNVARWSHSPVRLENLTAYTVASVNLYHCAMNLYHICMCAWINFELHQLTHYRRVTACTCVVYEFVHLFICCLFSRFNSVNTGLYSDLYFDFAMHFCVNNLEHFLYFPTKSRETSISEGSQIGHEFYYIWHCQNAQTFNISL
jgi:hypothetical protein